MASQAGKWFDGLTTFTDAHDSVQTLAGNATWITQFSPVKGPEKMLLRYCYGYFTD